jgi:hypothetical protein
MEELHLMNELRNIHTVVELGTVFDLIHRVCSQGQAIIKCKDCRRSPQASIMTFPALAEQCLLLFEAICAAYSINRQNTLFDPTILAFEQQIPPFICVRSAVLLGQTELNEEESVLLVRMLLSRNLMRLLGLLEALRDIMRARPKETVHTQRNGTMSFRAWDTSIESIIHRLVIFMEQFQLQFSEPCVLVVFRLRRLTDWHT